MTGYTDYPEREATETGSRFQYVEYQSVAPTRRVSLTSDNIAYQMRNKKFINLLNTAAPDFFKEGKLFPSISVYLALSARSTNITPDVATELAEQRAQSFKKAGVSVVEELRVGTLLRTRLGCSVLLGIDEYTVTLGTLFAPAHGTFPQEPQFDLPTELCLAQVTLQNGTLMRLGYSDVDLYSALLIMSLCDRDLAYSMLPAAVDTTQLGTTAV